MSNIAKYRRHLTSIVMLTSLSSFGGVVLRGMDMMIVEHLPGDDAFWSGFFAMGCGMSISRYTGLPPVRLIIGQGLRQGDYDRVFMSIQPYWVGDLEA